MIRNGKINDELWDDTKPKYSYKIIVIPSPVAGAGDEALRQMKDLYDLFGLVEQVCDKPKETVQAMHQYVADMSPADAVILIVGDAAEESAAMYQAYQENPNSPKVTYHGARVVVITVTSLIAALKARQVISGMTKATGKKAGGLRDFVGSMNPGLKQKFNELSEELKGKFYEDFEGVGLDDFNNRPELVGAWDILQGADNELVNALRTNFPTLDRLTDDITEAPSLAQFLKNNPSKVDEWSVLRDTYRSLGDPVKDVLGPGSVSHANEWNDLINEVESAGGTVEFTNNPDKIAYEPALSSGQPGRIFIQEDASITALRHEHRHFKDDQAEGYIGFQGLIDPNFRVTSECNAYKLEIEAMLEIGENGVAQTLKNNFLEEVNDIMAKFSGPDVPMEQSVLDYIDSVLNL